MSLQETGSRPVGLALILLLLWAGPTLWLGIRQSRLVIDPQNEALKSRGTREAADLDRMTRLFGSDAGVLLGFASAPGLDLDPAEEREIRRFAESLGIWPGVAAVSPVRAPDAGLRCFTVSFEPGVARDGAARVVAAAERSCPQTLHLRAAGQPLVESAIAGAVEQERAEVVPMIVLALLVLLWWSYRSLRIALLILLPAGVGILWTGGLLQVLGHRLDPLLVLLDPLLLTVGVAVSVHLVESFQRHRRSLELRAAARASRAELWQPMLLTTATSMVGFLSLLVSPIPAVGTFGVFATFGIAVSACFAIGGVPEFLAVIGPSRVPEPRIRAPLFHYVAWLRAHGWKVLVVVLFGAVFLLGYTGGVRVDNDPMKILTEDQPVRRHTNWLADRVGGVETFALLVPPGSRAAEPGLGGLITARQVDRPEIAALGGTPLRATEGDTLVTLVLKPSGSGVRERLFDAIEADYADFGAPEVHAVGTSVQVARDSGNLIRSQLLGLLLVVPMLGLAVTLGLRSVRLGLLSLIPNAMPCLLLHGAMAACEKSLSVATVMIGAVMMGLIVDDTIHFLHRFQEAVHVGRSRRLAVVEALRTTGRPITITSLVLFIGLGAGVAGSLSTTVEFSALAAVTIAVAWLLDVVVLPSLLLMPPIRWRARRRRIRVAPGAR